MTFKTIKNMIDFDNLISILLIFEAYSQMHFMNSSASLISQKVTIVEKAMTEVKKIRAEKQVVDVLNAWNNSIINSIYDLSLNSNVLMWRENNTN